MVTLAPKLSLAPPTFATPIAPERFAEVRRRTIFECCKWDPQVGDVSVLSPHPLVLERPTWDALAAWAEPLAAETLAAEDELLRRPDLHANLGLPRRVRRVLRDVRGPSAGVSRVMRFDFHFTTDGWRISEVNSDVPGGFIESSGFTRLVADCICSLSPSRGEGGGEGRAATRRVSADAKRVCKPLSLTLAPGRGEGTNAGALLQPAGDPSIAIADALCRSLGNGAIVALVHATAYTDDRQVMIYLARHIEARGMRACLVSPEHVLWDDRGRAHIVCDWFNGPVDALLRFFPAEWLANLPRRANWRCFFGDSPTPQCNPAAALLTQSKRFPLVWDELRTPLPTWRELLPATHDPREVRWRDNPEWVLKPAMGRVGDGVRIDGVTTKRDSKQISRDAWWHPRWWVAQRRFQAVPIATGEGSPPLYPCVGVYVIDGRAAGAYGRASERPLIDQHAMDVAVLVKEEVQDAECGMREYRREGDSSLAHSFRLRMK